jgi:hypothetical protein
MNAEELKEFFAAMDLVREANAPFPKVACILDEQDDLELDCFDNDRCDLPTIH